MADLSSTRVFGKLTVMHEAILKANAEITGTLTAGTVDATTYVGLPTEATRWPEWNEVTGKPTTFAPSAHTHPWGDLTGVPATASRWPTWAEVTSKPSFAAVATSGSYADLSNTPNLSTVATTGSYTDLVNRPGNATPTTSGFMASGDKSKLDGIESGAEVNTVDSVNGQTGVVSLDTNDVSEGTNLYFTTARARSSISVGGDLSYTNGIISFSETYSTPAEIKTAYESNSNTNAYTDAEKTKLSGIASGAEVNTVDSVAGKTGAVSLVKSDVGLGNVRNVSSYSQTEANSNFQSTLVSGTNIKTLNSQSLLGSGNITIDVGADISDSAPVSPQNGKFWWNSSDGNLYVYYNDGDSSQWVTSVTKKVGPKGEKGDKGDGATISVGTVTTGTPGSSATVTNSGTAGDAILDFSIPEGLKGDKGDTGDNPLDVLDAWQSTSDTVNRLRFDTNSHTYIGTDATHIFKNGSNTTTATLDASGNFVATGDVTAYSDSRIKSDVEKIPDAIEKVNSLNGYTFRRINDFDNRRHTGLIAQEVLDVLPEAVIGGPTESDPEGKYSLAYGNMVGLLVEAIKDQQKQIDELKKRLDG